MQVMSEGDVEAAAALFENPEWKATANYRGEKFEDAASQYGGIDTADSKYNLGNAFAKQNLLDEAIEAYDQALAADPDNEDAKFNKALIEQLQQQQQQQEQQDQDSEDSEEQQDKEQDQKDQEEQEKEQQDQKEQQEEQDSQQEQDEKEQEQQEKEQQEQAQEEQEEQANQKPAEEESEPLDEEEKQALQQWLRRVPDDPGGLLRRKFQMQYEERLREGKVSSNDSTTDW